MNKIEAIVKPFKLEQVKEALAGLGIEGMTVSEVKGCGHHRGLTEIHGGTEYAMDFLPKIKVEVVVTDDLTAAACDAVIKAARTGTSGGERVFVGPIEEAVRIRTAETGDRALMFVP
jgi:nitrogen regulatory protein PII